MRHGRSRHLNKEKTCVAPMALCPFRKVYPGPAPWANLSRTYGADGEISVIECWGFFELFPLSAVVAEDDQGDVFAGDEIE